jgi:ribonuclease-3
VIPSFENPALLFTALTHKSYANEHSTKETPVQNNERLEFLGDAIVNFIAAEWLYQQFPTLGEGRLTSLRAALIRAATLAQFAHTIGLPSMLNLGKGEEDKDEPELYLFKANARDKMLAFVRF